MTTKTWNLLRVEYLAAKAAHEAAADVADMGRLQREPTAEEEAACEGYSSTEQATYKAVIDYAPQTWRELAEKTVLLADAPAGHQAAMETLAEDAAVLLDIPPFEEHVRSSVVIVPGTLNTDPPKRELS